jgi:methanogenic corrinoid protein MtbC1
MLQSSEKASRELLEGIRGMLAKCARNAYGIVKAAPKTAKVAAQVMQSRDWGALMGEAHNLSSLRGAAANARLRLGVRVEPPIPLDVEDVREREVRLAALAAEEVIPRLLAIHNQIIVPVDHDRLHAGSIEIEELSRLVLRPDGPEALDYIQLLRDRGLSLDQLHEELLEPTARHLGELWEADRIDFVDVAVGVSKLQRMVHYFARLDAIPPYDDRLKALITTTPGDSHSFGNAIVQKFLRASGWHVCACSAPGPDELASLVADEWFGVVGFSVSADQHLDALASAIRRVREVSLNRTIGIMVGGPCFESHDERVSMVGADGTARNGPAAAILAKKLLVRSLPFTDLPSSPLHPPFDTPI